MISITRESHEVTLCWLEKLFFVSADVSMPCYVCVVSQYLQFYDQDLDKYQLLPHPYLGLFEGDNGEKALK